MLKHAENQVVIRKYANRRLYDTSVSRYVTIDDLGMMVKDNIDFRVVDATNGQDITRVTLVQIILEIVLIINIGYSNKVNGLHSFN